MGGQAPEWKLHPKGQSLNKLGQAVTWYHWRKSEATQGASPEGRSFASEVEGLRGMFLRRPDCPQFCSRATSVSNYGRSRPRGPRRKHPPLCWSRDLPGRSTSEITVFITAHGIGGGRKGPPAPVTIHYYSSPSLLLLRVSFTRDSAGLEVGEMEQVEGSGSFRKEVCKAKHKEKKKVPVPEVLGRCDQSSAGTVTSAGSASSVALPGVACLGSEAWKMPKDSPSSQQGLDAKVDGSLLPVSKSACEFNYLRKKSESPTLSPVPSSLVPGQSHLRKRVPWYISVIHEKDHCLSTLGAEVQRLLELEVQVRRKDEEISALQEEREALRKQLRDLSKGKVSEAPASQGTKERTSDLLMKPWDRQSFLQTCVRDEEEELRQWRQMQEEYVKGHGARGVEAAGEEEWGLEGADEGAQKGAEREGGGEEGVEEEEVELELDQEQEPEGRAGGRRMACFPDEDFEEELMAQLQEYEQVIQEFQFELEVARTRLSLATGACISLQRQVDHQQTQLQKADTESQLLQRELRERQRQLQAMTDKFSSLREEKKWEEVKGLIEKDNLLLRQQVLELERELLNRERALAESDAQVSQLQAQVAQSEKRQQTWQQLQEVTRDKVEAVQQAEQQTRVALESAQSRLERLRNRIIQATFGASGAKSVSTEISDSDILEALQRLVLERAEYYSQLKQRGFKGPAPPQSELSSQGRAKKVASSK
ncbi:coiled-coil domain-containing protein 27 [Sturnira hondurensis]|uniref:coiled-coil domain-containing protein 27 n=1 Tax=Sturnira hondurensis TaxID=192404 RepID=UPI0018795283|nr:coiled-coil domain-containing protein 27 [Sturnira hondurensis]